LTHPRACPLSSSQMSFGRKLKRLSFRTPTLCHQMSRGHFRNLHIHVLSLPWRSFSNVVFFFSFLASLNYRDCAGMTPRPGSLAFPCVAFLRFSLEFISRSFSFSARELFSFLFLALPDPCNLSFFSTSRSLRTMRCLPET